MKESEGVVEEVETEEEIEMRKELERILSLAKIVRVKYDKEEESGKGLFTINSVLFSVFINI